ncbi:unnamed protein product [Rotaria sp. Silwood2]|nr:unnamed protein product [Rotaria sp. Silwood2]CAF2933109.1 unnamed protein product [Rotaria sp. Silwood2]
MNPGFSSTTGVLIAMNRFRQITYHANSQTVDLGSGLLWDDVYRKLDPLGVTAIGSRVSGVGVAGLTLGGGYSWKSNQYGLTIDNVVEYEFGWESSSDNNAFIDGLKSTTNTILQAALDDGQDIGGSKQIRYPNNALGDTPLEQMYGDNVAKLRSIRQAWDPYNIMYLCGGFKF